MTNTPLGKKPQTRVGKPKRTDVGYKLPPKEHQFQPNQSGNPGGRKKGAIGLKKILEQELTSTIKIDVGKPGEPKKVTLSKLQIVVKRLVEKAMKGDQRAIEQLITLNITIFGLGNEDDAAEKQLTPGEQAYLDQLSKRFASGDAEADHEADPSAVAKDADEEDRDA